MKLLFLAPQPFFIERGTPIAVKLALQVLGARTSGNLSIDLLTYHEGREVPLPSVTHYRTPAFPLLSPVGPGISIRKLACDFFFFLRAFGLAFKNRKNQYALVHAVEESVFVALCIKFFFGVPYVYDMDSSLAAQITEKWRWLRWCRGLLERIERIAIKNSLAVVPVCDSLAEIAYHHGSRHISVLRDVSLLKAADPSGIRTLHSEIGLPLDRELIIYIGNLEHYQGIDLLLESFAILVPQHKSSHLVIVGGTKGHIDSYTAKSLQLEIADRVHFIGPRPIAEMDKYIHEADILVSPRTKGENTPMKIYSYLHSGRAIVATNLKTHTQVLTEDVALLPQPDEVSFAEALLVLLENPKKRESLGASAKALADKFYTFEAFSQKLNETYDTLLAKL